jgi:RNA polymerase sigma-70 factor (ECF subfamily)
LTGERQAWDELFEDHCGAIRAVAAWKKWGFDPLEAEDVCQNIMEAVIKSLKSFEFKSRLSTFIYKIAVSTCVAQLRNKTARKRGSGFSHLSLDTAEAECVAEPCHAFGSRFKDQEQLLLDREMLQSLIAALAKLGEPCKELIQSRYFNEVSFREISQKTGVKENTLVVQMKRCLVRLSNYLQAEV